MTYFLVGAKKLMENQPVAVSTYLLLCREAIHLAKEYPKARDILAIELVSVGAYLREDYSMAYKCARTVADEAIDLEWDVPDGRVDPDTGLSALQKWAQFEEMVESAITTFVND